MTRIRQVFGFGPSRQDQELMENVQIWLHVNNYVLPPDGKLNARPTAVVVRRDPKKIHVLYVSIATTNRQVGSIDTENNDKITYTPAK